MEALTPLPPNDIMLADLLGVHEVKADLQWQSAETRMPQRLSGFPLPPDSLVDVNHLEPSFLDMLGSDTHGHGDRFLEPKPFAPPPAEVVRNVSAPAGNGRGAIVQASDTPDPAQIAVHLPRAGLAER